jgi:hypothetical protein
MMQQFPHEYLLEHFRFVTSYLSAPNIINTLNPHPGFIYRMHLPHAIQVHWWHVAECLVSALIRQQNHLDHSLVIFQFSATSYQQQSSYEISVEGLSIVSNHNIQAFPHDLSLYTATALYSEQQEGDYRILASFKLSQSAESLLPTVVIYSDLKDGDWFAKWNPLLETFISPQLPKVSPDDWQIAAKVFHDPSIFDSVPLLTIQRALQFYGTSDVFLTGKTSKQVAPLLFKEIHATIVKRAAKKSHGSSDISHYGRALATEFREFLFHLERILQSSMTCFSIRRCGSILLGADSSGISVLEPSVSVTSLVYSHMVNVIKLPVFQLYFPAAISFELTADGCLLDALIQCYSSLSDFNNRSIISHFLHAVCSHPDLVTAELLTSLISPITLDESLFEFLS